MSLANKIVDSERSAQRWKFLSSCKTKRTRNEVDNETLDCIFSCSDIDEKSAKNRVEEILEAKVEEWNELDERRLNTENKLCKKSRLLPADFDTHSPPEESNEQEEHGDKVISLRDPSKLLSYKSELYKFFATVPTFAECNSNGSKTQLSQLKNEIEDALKEYTRVDIHSLSRLKIRSLHHLPLRAKQNNIIRIECWNQIMKRGSSPDPYRFESEFDINSTLLEVHNCIIEQYRLHDDISKQKDDSGLFLIEDTFYVHGENYQQYLGPIMAWLSEKTSDETGVIFPRVECLRIPSAFLQNQHQFKLSFMSSTYLNSLQFRLATRYVHLCQNFVESIVLFSDVQFCKSLSSLKAKTRIIDSFTFTHFCKKCQGCNHAVAKVVCWNDELCCGGSPTLLCSYCFWNIMMRMEIYAIIIFELCSVLDDLLKNRSKSDETIDA